MGLLVDDPSNFILGCNQRVFSVLEMMNMDPSGVETKARTDYFLNDMLPDIAVEGKNYLMVIDSMSKNGFIKKPIPPKPTNIINPTTTNLSPHGHTNTIHYPPQPYHNFPSDNQKLDIMDDSLECLDDDELNIVIDKCFNPNNNHPPFVSLPGEQSTTSRSSITNDMTEKRIQSNAQQVQRTINDDSPYADVPMWKPMEDERVKSHIILKLLDNVDEQEIDRLYQTLPNGDVKVMHYIKSLLNNLQVFGDEVDHAATIYLKYIDVFPLWKQNHIHLCRRDRKSLDGYSLEKSFSDNYEKDSDYIPSSDESAGEQDDGGPGGTKRSWKAEDYNYKNDPNQVALSPYGSPFQQDKPKMANPRRTKKQRMGAAALPPPPQQQYAQGMSNNATVGGIGHSGITNQRNTMNASANNEGDAHTKNGTSNSSRKHSSLGMSGTSSVSSSLSSSAFFEPPHALENTPFPDERILMGVSMCRGPGSGAAGARERQLTTISSPDRVDSIRQSTDYSGTARNPSVLVQHDFWPDKYDRGASFPRNVSNGEDKHNPAGSYAAHAMNRIHKFTLVNTSLARDGVVPNILKPGDVVTTHGNDVTWVKECWYVGVYLLIDGREIGNKVGIVKVLYDQLSIYLNRVGVIAESNQVNGRRPSKSFVQNVYGCNTVHLIDGNFKRMIRKPSTLVQRKS